MTRWALWLLIPVALVVLWNFKLEENPVSPTAQSIPPQEDPTFVPVIAPPVVVPEPVIIEKPSAPSVDILDIKYKCSNIPQSIKDIPSLPQIDISANILNTDITPYDQYYKITKSASQFIADASKFSDIDDIEIKKCTVRWLESWASQEAYLGSISGNQAQFEKQRFFISAALIFLKVKDFATTSQYEKIQKWIERLAVDTTKFITISKREDAYEVWQGLGLAAFSIATNNKDYLQIANNIAQKALSRVDANGLIPVEMQRNEKSLFYHSFTLTALTPLVKLLNIDDSKLLPLRRLAAVTYNGLTNDAVFVKTFNGIVRGIVFDPRKFTYFPYAGIGWYPIFRDENLYEDHPFFDNYSMTHPWLGGDVNNLIKAGVKSRKR